MNTIRHVVAAVLLPLSAIATLPAPGSAQGTGGIKLTPNDGAAGDCFGVSVSVAADLALVGTPYNQGSHPNSGSAYLFDATTGQQLLKLVPLDWTSDFGCSVSLGDGLALVGAPEDGDNASCVGAAYLFDAATGQQLQKLLAKDGEENDYFGWRVSLSGGLALVGAFEADEWSGSAYVFHAGSGYQLHKLKAEDWESYDHFGWDVSLSGDLALVGAPRDADNGQWSGSAYVFDATTGQQLLKLLPEDGTEFDEFGRSASLCGGLALVGAPNSSEHGSSSGSAYVFDATTGLQLAKLVPDDVAEGDHFGFKVSISGTTALIASPADVDNGKDSGSAYLFDALSGQQLRKLLPMDGAPNDCFGVAVSLSETLAVGGAYKDEDNGIWSGSAYVFDAVEGGPGVGYCFGDLGSDTPCPCGNDNDGSVPGSGCANGVFASGARLTGSGAACVSEDTLVLTTIHLEPGNSCLHFQSDGALSQGAYWGDGLRCTSGTTRYLEVGFADPSGTASTTIGISAKVGGIHAGDTRYYQCVYRNPDNSQCSYELNTSNGYAITWWP